MLMELEVTNIEAGDEARLFERFAQTRDPADLERLTVRYMPLARKLAARYGGGRESFEDLLQVASIGLVNAINRFEPERGFAFSSFAAPTILGELRRHFRDRGWAVRISRDLQERSLQVEKASSELPTRLGRSPSVMEIAEHVRATEEEVLEAIEAGHAHHVASIDARRDNGDGESQSIVETIGDLDGGFETVEHAVQMSSAVTGLSKRDRLVLFRRFAEDRTQSEIAEEIGVSQMQVSRILRASLQKMRYELDGDGSRDNGAG